MKAPLRSLAGYWGDLPVRTKGLVVIALPLLAFVASTLFILVPRKMQADATTWVRQSQEVRLEIRDFRETLLEAEDSARGIRSAVGRPRTATNRREIRCLRRPPISLHW
jgi:hypothetical protein